MQRLNDVIVSVAVCILAVLVAVVIYWHSQYKLQKQEAERLQHENDLQTSVISIQAFQFNRFNQIVADQNHYAVTIASNQQEKEIEYRTILKAEPTCNLPVPADVAGGLLRYAHSLRASAMHTDPIQSDSSSTGTATARQLTYCEAVLWIDPLLTAIDQANSQLAGIRQIESLRASQ